MEDLLGLDSPTPASQTNSGFEPEDPYASIDEISPQGKNVSTLIAVAEVNNDPTNDVYAVVNKQQKKKKPAPQPNGNTSPEGNGAPPVPKRLVTLDDEVETKSNKRISWADEKPREMINTKSSHHHNVVINIQNDDNSITEHPTPSREKIEFPQFSSGWNSLFGGIDDGKEWKEPTTQMEVWQMKTKTFVDNFSVRLFSVILITLDIILVIMDLAMVNKTESAQDFYDITALIISCIFMVDLCLRIFAYTPRGFFSQTWEVIDAIIIILTFLITIVYVILDNYIEASTAASLAKLIVLARALRIVRFARIFYGKEQMKTSSRQTVSQNKRRYQKDGFDLDLTYITDRVIAMSFPSSGRQSIFRNPIEEVSRFMKTKHPGNYKVYNLCSERGYDPSWFEGNVSRIFIDDHNVPKLPDMIRFAEDAKEWMGHPSRVIAIHCKGGKGRTGTMVCTWLLEADLFATAEEALTYFGERRTDVEKGETFQGVETASQIRYVEYFERIKKEFGGKLPPTRILKLKKVTIYSIKGVGRGNGSDLTMQVVIQGKEHFQCKFGEQYQCEVEFDNDENKVECNVVGCGEFEGDIKIRFSSSVKELPKGYDNCPFYFWFNTSFIGNDNKLRLERKEIDNPHKKKTWHIFQEDFAIELEFENATEC